MGQGGEGRKGEWEMDGKGDVRLSVVEFGVGGPAGVEDVGGGPVGVEGSDGLEEGGDCEKKAAGGEEGCHGIGLASEGWGWTERVG